MQAVVLAGGMGTRLRPLTFTRPKPLLPLSGKPMILHVLEHLPKEVDDILLTVSYMPEMLSQYFEANPIGRRVEIVVEKEPLGTGGAVKNVRERLNGPFLVLNADIVSSIDYSSMMQIHEESGVVGTISLFEVDDPTPYGMVTMEDGGRITEFTEKPEAGMAKSNLVNAGTYVLELEALDYMPARRNFSIERDVFPELLNTVQGMQGFQFSGYWTDAGTPDKFLLAQHYISSGLPGGCYVPESAVVRGHMGDNVALGEGVLIERDARLSNCALLDCALVEEGCLVEDSLIGEGCIIKKESLIKGCVIGDGTALEGEHVGERIGGNDGNP